MFRWKRAGGVRRGNSLRSLFLHRHTWRPLRVEYRYPDYKTGHRITVKRCQCRDCGKIAYIHFDGKNIM